MEEVKERWWQRQEAAWHEAAVPQLAQLKQETEQALVTATHHREDAEHLQQEAERLKESTERQKRDLDDLLRRQEDRKAELVSVNEELKAQIRLIEAKARPDAVWLTAFQAGYSKAWETMLPIMQGGMKLSNETMRQEALTAALATVEPAIEQRVVAKVNDIQRLRTFKELTAKRSELESKRTAAPVTDQPRYEHYLEALGWALDGHHPSA